MQFFNKIFVGKRNAHVEEDDTASFRKRFVIRRFIDVFPSAFAAVGKVYRSFYAVRLYELFGIRSARITVDGIARSVQAAGRNASRFYFAEIGKNFVGCIVASVFAFFKLADFIVGKVCALPFHRDGDGSAGCSSTRFGKIAHIDCERNASLAQTDEVFSVIDVAVIRTHGSIEGESARLYRHDVARLETSCGKFILRNAERAVSVFIDR